MFNNMVAHLTFSGVIIDLVDKVNHYLKSLETVFPSWVERQRSTLRTMKAIGAIVTALNFEFIMADILKEQRNPTSITFKKMASYEVNRPSKDSTHQNKDTY